MMFSEVKGNSAVCRALAGMVDSGRVPHAILLHEDDGGGAFSVAQAFLQYLFCQDRREGDSCGTCPSCNKISKLIHPDVHYIFPVSGAPSSSFIGEFRSTVKNEPFFTESLLYENLGLEGKSTLINVNESKEVLEMLSLSALEGGYKAVVIYLPEKMNKDAGNRLLKSIEEPPEKTQFILISHSPETVLPTIVSRCQCIRVVPEKDCKPVAASIETAYADLFASLMTALVSRDLLTALEVGDEIAALPSRESAKGFCRYAAERVRDIFLLQQDMASLLSNPQDSEAAGWAKGCRRTFSRGALVSLSRARQMIDRNVGQKIVFTDLVNRLFLIV